MLYFLVGYMGTGKSYWGRRWATAFGLQFYDLDRVVEERAGKSIADIFETEGEAAFRKQEEAGLLSLLSLDKAIIATGGGAPCFHSNIETMNEHGMTIYLKSSVEDLVKRLEPERAHRPLLAKLSAQELGIFIEGKLKERDQFYDRSFYHFNTQFLQDDNFKKIIDRHA